MDLVNHEGYPDPTADLAVGRVYRLSKKKKPCLMGMSPVNAGVMSGESASASEESIACAGQRCKSERRGAQEVSG